MKNYSTICVFLLSVCCSKLCAWPQDIPAGFATLTGKHIEVVTDIPINAEIRELTAVFDAAIPQWCQIFDVAESEIADWQLRAYVMLDRQRFKSNGLLPAQLPEFPHGFQYGNQVWVAEQVSAYYRRHLLLHEGTHWFMNRKYGRNGPPWLMEGMAEWLGTHRWDGTRLQLGIIPQNKQEVPLWGRISLIQTQLAEGVAPSLETVLRYANDAHQHPEAYAWSWAAVIFLSRHPETQDAFQAMLATPIISAASLNRSFVVSVQDHWPRVRQYWNAFLSELVYGYTPDFGMMTLSPQPQPLNTRASHQLSLRVDRSWQPSGIHVEAGQRFKILADGEYVIRRTTTGWLCQPQGLTLEYEHGKPLGQLTMTAAQAVTEEPQFAQPLIIQAVGRGGEFVSTQAGELMFRVNETSGGLVDNVGEISITIGPSVTATAQ